MTKFDYTYAGDLIQTMPDKDGNTTTYTYDNRDRLTAPVRKTLITRVLAVAALMLGALSGCTSVDPTEQAFAIRFHNDTSRTHVLRRCDDSTCRTFHEHLEIRPDHSTAENVSDRGAVTTWLREDSSGRPEGCIALKFESKYADVVVPLSRARTCSEKHVLSIADIPHGSRRGGWQ